MYSFKTSHEEIKFLIKMTNYIMRLHQNWLCKPQNSHHEWWCACIPVYWNTPGIILVSNGIKKFMKVVVWTLCWKVVDLILKSFKTLGSKAHSFTKLKPQNSCLEMEYCHVGMNIWFDLRHFAKCRDAQDPPCTFHAAGNHNLNKRFILYMYPDLQLYTYMHKF